MRTIKGKEFTMLKKAILPLALMMVSGAASAGVVTNDTALLSGSDHAQLSEWLGSDFDLTRIFAKEDGDNSQDWHVAVDGQGATFTVMELFDNDTNERRVIGGTIAIVGLQSRVGHKVKRTSCLTLLTLLFST